MKRSIVMTTSVAASIGMMLVAAGPASATTLYKDQNYSGASFTATSAPNVGSMNDKSSSATATRAIHYFEDAGYLGRSIVLTGNQNYLQSYSSGLHFGETWNDRISSFKNN